jgi:hypothetical protein
MTPKKKTAKTTKPAPKTLREEDVVTKPQRRVGVRTRTGVQAGDKNANNGHT